MFALMANPRIPAVRAHSRIPVAIDVMVNGVLNFIEGRITDLSEGGARIDGASLPPRSRCEIHYAGEVVYAVVMWSEFDRMGIRFPYELADGALHGALVRARAIAAAGARPVFPSHRPAVFGRRGIS